MQNDPDEFKRRMAFFSINEALNGMIEEFTQNGQLPPGR